jgi:activating signal cointegrator complex subunit 1
MVSGNLDLHRGLSGPTLYTNISVGAGAEALLSGGPKDSGPNAVAGTTWWHIVSQQPLEPNRSNGKAGACSYGPSINLVGVDIEADKVGDWWGPLVPAAAVLLLPQY